MRKSAVYKIMACSKKASFAIQPKFLLSVQRSPVIKQYVIILELLGKKAEAYKLLEHHVNGLNHHGCLVPLVNLYSKYGDIPKILALLQSHREYFSKNASLQIKAGLSLRNNGDIVPSYTIFKNYLDTYDNLTLNALKNKFIACQHLWLLDSIIKNHELFRQHFIGTIDLPTPPVFNNSLIHKAFESIRKKDWSKAEPLLKKSLAEDSDSCTTQFLSHVTQHAKNIHTLCDRSTLSFMDIRESPVSAIKFSEQLIFKIRHKIPSSIIRLGDGEGMFLAYPPQYKAWQEADIEHSQRLWWGDIKFDESSKNEVISLFYESIRNADILGIPDLTRMVISDDMAHTPSYRGLRAIFNHLNNETYLAPKSSSTILTSCHFHTALEFWDLYRYILTNVDEVTVITCHPGLGQKIQDKFGITIVKTITLPPEHKYSHNFNVRTMENNHFPEFFDLIMATLDAKKGEIFLVAAGFLGKIYCNEIKKKGGIGIDIGSIADVWMGYSTRFEHESLHRIRNISIDLDRLRQKTFPGHKKVKDTHYYRSNYYGDINIYREGDEYTFPDIKGKKKLLITGHPRCGSNYMSLLLNELGIGINHECFGKDGICSWLFAVKDLNTPILGSRNIEPAASYFTEFEHTLAYIRDPFDAIPSIIIENRGERSYNFRRNHIIKALGIDLDDYPSDLERAVASYLYWNKIVQLKHPTAIFKVEDCIQDVHDFLLDNGLIGKPVDLSCINVQTNVNSTLSFGLTKPEILLSDYSKVAGHLKDQLRSFCETYGYVDSGYNSLH